MRFFDERRKYSHKWMDPERTMYKAITRHEFHFVLEIGCCCFSEKRALTFCAVWRLVNSHVFGKIVQRKACDDLHVGFVQFTAYCCGAVKSKELEFPSKVIHTLKSRRRAPWMQIAESQISFLTFNSLSTWWSGKSKDVVINKINMTVECVWQIAQSKNMRRLTRAFGAV